MGTEEEILSEILINWPSGKEMQNQHLHTHDKWGKPLRTRKEEKSPRQVVFYSLAYTESGCTK
jgi:hypothetical protein